MSRRNICRASCDFERCERAEKDFLKVESSFGPVRDGISVGGPDDGNTAIHGWSIVECPDRTGEKTGTESRGKGRDQACSPAPPEGITTATRRPTCPSPTARRLAAARDTRPLGHSHNVDRVIQVLASRTGSQPASRAIDRDAAPAW